jgi:signal transduction histidine kinase
MSGGPAILVLPFLVALVSVYLCGCIIGQKRHSPASRAFVYFVAALLATTVIEFLYRLDFSPSVNDVLTRIGLAALLSVGFFYMKFIFAVTETPVNRTYRLIKASVPVCIAVSMYPGMFWTSYPEELGGVPITGLSPSLITVMGTIILLPCCYGALLCLKKYRDTKDSRQRQILRLLITGIFMSLSIGIFIFAVVPVFLPDHPEIYLFSNTGSLIHFAYMYQAVSKHHFLSINIDEVEQVSRTLFGNSMDAVVVFGTKGDVIQANTKAAALFGGEVTRTAVQGTISGYVFSQRYDKWHTTILDEIDQHILVSQFGISTAGQRFGQLLLVRDITDFVRLEKQVQEVEKLKAVGLLAGGVAHDFNNQLMSIMGNAELLQSRLADQESLLKYVEGILLSSRRSADLTSQLLAFARRGKFRLVAVDLHAIIHEVVELIAHSMDKRIEITLNLQAAPATTQGDPSQLQNAVLNLALNARDAMGAGGTLTFRSVVVSREQVQVLLPEGTDGAANFIKLTVADTGVGIDLETRPHIFEPFFTTKEAGLGTGMGLAAVQGTIQNHRGAIDIESQPGKGTEVHVYFPLYEGKVEEPAPVDDSTNGPGGSGRILVVDDEPLVREVAGEMLQSLGYTVSLCSEGEEALALFRREASTIDVVIIDLIMPKMTGLELLQEMRQISTEVKILIASGYNKVNEPKGFRGQGENGFLQKPFTLDDLSKALADL